ncbi:MAG: hypothetical protein EZS28_033108 [Streblomastix strix]|uniref:Uncharacterized protein n=1 Tax=Streblomastix strix TaxID=222440 RepID=A0A5J4ULR7_9EUKA|nr:MAG: hypothetical protein EZS28_033108 [Streblomastix strix]
MGGNIGTSNAIFRDRAAPDSSFSEFDAFKLCMSRKSVRKNDLQKQEFEPEIQEKINSYLNDEKKMTGPFGSRIRIILRSTEQAEDEKLGTYGMIKGGKYFVVGIKTNETKLHDF